MDDQITLFLGPGFDLGLLSLKMCLKLADCSVLFLSLSLI